jgi:N-acetylglucosamine-6-phosphate deacetylase
MTHWISANQVFDGHDVLENHAVLIADGFVAQIKPVNDVNPQVISHTHKGLITPGFFDIQVNGGGGVLLNTDPTPHAISTIAAAHRQFGTTAILPTVITDAPAVLEAAVDAAKHAKDIAGFAGLHIEGPHISVARRGTHAERFVRPLDPATIALVRSLRDADIATLITVAPEAATPAQITVLRDMGAVVSIGHSDADAQQTQACVAAGATCFTHIFNAMSPMLHREPGVTGAAIASNVWCSIIADGIHVDPLMVTLAMRARPVPDRMIAVSDAMSTVGGPDHFDLYGQTIRLQDGKLVNAEGSLAGAHLSMHKALQNLVSYGVELQAALRMCRTSPYALMGLPERAKLVGLAVSDIVFLDENLDLQTFDMSAPLAVSQPV